MVTGGINSDDGHLTEVGGSRGGFAGKDEINSFRCILPRLPHGRSAHTQSGLEVCGGHDSNTMTNCLTFSDSNWTTSHTLLHPRSNHTSWISPEGVVLMGGSFSPNTTELLSNYHFQVRGRIENGSKRIFKGDNQRGPHHKDQSTTKSSSEPGNSQDVHKWMYLKRISGAKPELYKAQPGQQTLTQKYTNY